MVKKKTLTADDIIEFWFDEIDPKQWWEKNPDFDKHIKKRFLKIHKQAAAGELFNWRYEPLSALAEIIILDQFSRNMFRDKMESFTYDNLAVCLCQSAIDKGLDKELNIHQKAFMYMPLMHSESLEIHKAAELLYSDLAEDGYYQFELKHKAIIDRFGRYPHRNKILGRKSKKTEIEFLKEANSSF